MIEGEAMSRKEIFVQLEEDRKKSMEKRACNRTNSALVLQEHGIPFESKNDGVHLVVGNKPYLFDFWPGTGKWKCRRTGNEGRGVFTLLDQLKQIAAVAWQPSLT